MSDTSRLKDILRPGDHVVWGQGTAEPIPLTEALVAQRHVLGPLSVFVGVCFTDTLMPNHTDVLKVSSYGALGTTRRLAAAGALEIAPHHVSKLGTAIERSHIGCDVAMVQLSVPGPNGRPSLGPINDYMRAAMRRARAVIVSLLLFTITFCKRSLV